MIVGSAGLMLGSLVVRDDCGPIESKFRRLVAMILLLSLSHCPSPGLVATIVFTFKITQTCVRQSQSTVAHKVHTLKSPSGAIKISPIPSPEIAQQYNLPQMMMEMPPSPSLMSQTLSPFFHLTG